MKKLLALASALVLSVSTLTFPQKFLEKLDFTANAEVGDTGTYGDLTYQIASDNTITITGFDINRATVDIPNEIDGMIVKRIGVQAFQGAARLMSVEIPETVTEIEAKAFYECEALTNVVIPDSVVKLGSYAFGRCYKLESIQLPKTITKIPSRCFFMCQNLQTIEFPETVSEIDYGAFEACSSLDNIKLPSGLTKLADRVFYGCVSLREIEVPSGIQTIGELCFSSCLALETAVINEGTTFIDDSVFEYCPALKKVVLPRSLNTYGSWIFYRCPEDLVLYVYRNSPSETYAKEKSLKYEYIDNGEFKYQLKDLQDGSFGVRFLLIVNEEDVVKADGASVYMTVPGQGDSENYNITRAYRSVIASGQTVSAGEGKVFLIGQFMGIPEDLLNGIVAHFEFLGTTYERTVVHSM